MIRARLLVSVTLGTLLLGSVALALLAEPVSSQTANLNRAGLRLKPVGRFNVPTFITSAPQDQGRIFVVERRGTIRIVRGSKSLPQPFLDISKIVGAGGERGLLSMAFRPDYAQSGVFYVYYTAHNGALTIAEYRRSATDPDQAVVNSARRVMVIPHRNHNHNSGQLQFGPDGYLYAGTGDGGGSNDRSGNAQDLRTRLGKILRFDPTGTTEFQRSSPPDNPFIGRPEVQPEIWAKGFRNPWRFSFDQMTGDLAIADVGQNTVEEIDFVRKGSGAGENFGWNECEGSYAFPLRGRPRKKCDLDGSIRPAIEHFHSSGFCSVIGGVIVRDRSLVGLYGRYIYGDLCRPELRSAVLNTSGATQKRRVGLDLDGVISFGQSSSGCVYVGTFQAVYRIAPAAKTAPCPLGPKGPVADAAADRQRPTVSASARGGVRARRARGIVVSVRCDEPCRVQASALLARVSGRPFTRAFAGTRRFPGGRARRLKIPLRGRGLGARFANLRVRVTDKASNVTTVRRSLRLAR